MLVDLTILIIFNGYKANFLFFKQTKILQKQNNFVKTAK